MNRIVRSWTCWIRTEHIDVCRERLAPVKLAQMRAAEGNLRATTLYRSLPDGTTEVVFMSLWDSMESVRLFAGADTARPTVDPSQYELFVDREPIVRQYEIAASEADPRGAWAGWH